MALGPFTKRDHLEIASLGLQFAVTQTLGVFGGWWLDRRWNTLPWFTLACAAAGFAAGMYMVVSGARAAQSREDKNLSSDKAEKKDGRS